VGQRRSARENALQALFELEFNDAGPEAVLARQGADKKTAPAVLDYAAWLVRGVAARRDEIDSLIQGMSSHWRVARMTPIDRNILRIAAFEMIEGKFLAPAIVINEAIEIAKRFSGDEGAVFVNGVLDAVRKKLAGEQPSPKENDHDRTPKPDEAPAGRADRVVRDNRADRVVRARGRRPKK
jgi:N utilization substance protein B